MATPKVVNWIRKMIAHDGGEASDTVARLVLRHQSPSAAQGADVHSIRVPKTLPGDPCEDWATEMEQAASEDAEGLAGAVQTYVIYAFATSDRSLARPISRCPLRIAAEGNELATMSGGGRGGGLNDDSGGLDSEPANLRGLLSQLMRHNEGSNRTLVLGTQQLLMGLSRQNQKLQEMVERSFDRDLETMKMMESMHSERHEREVITVKAVKQEERKSEAFEKIMMLLPNVVNRLAGKKVMNETTSPMEEMIDKFGSSLKDHQVEKFMSILDGDQQMLMLSVIQSIRAKQQAEKDTREAAAAERATKEAGTRNGNGARGVTMPGPDSK